METVLVVPIVCKNSALPRDIEEAKKNLWREETICLVKVTQLKRHSL